MKNENDNIENIKKINYGRIERYVDSMLSKIKKEIMQTIISNIPYDLEMKNNIIEISDIKNKKDAINKVIIESLKSRVKETDNYISIGVNLFYKIASKYFASKKELNEYLIFNEIIITQNSSVASSVEHIRENDNVKSVRTIRISKEYLINNNINF